MIEAPTRLQAMRLENTHRTNTDSGSNQVYAMKNSEIVWGLCYFYRTKESKVVEIAWYRSVVTWESSNSEHDPTSAHLVTALRPGETGGNPRFISEPPFLHEASLRRLVVEVPTSTYAFRQRLRPLNCIEVWYWL